MGMIGDATARGYRMVWDIAVQFVLHNLLSITILLLLVLVMSAIQAFTTGRWGWFGSVLYNYMFGGVMIAVGFIWGPETFANDYFEIVSFLIYIICFCLVGVILKKTGLRRRF